jgi:putative transposase
MFSSREPIGFRSATVNLTVSAISALELFERSNTSNPIESVFATVRHRTVRMKGALSQDTARLMVFKLVMAASKTWRRLNGQNQLPKVFQGVTFKDGIEVATEIKSAA